MDYSANIKITNKNLYRPTRRIDIDSEDFTRVVRAANKMLPYMRSLNGIGLSANQVGIARSFFVMDCGTPKVIVNPEILKSVGPDVDMVEGCLSFPKLGLEVARPMGVIVQYTNQHREVIVEQLTGLEARCFQHEFDHLSGITFHQRTKENTAQ